VWTSGEDLGDRGGGHRGRERRRMGDRHGSFGFGVGRRGRGGAWQRGRAAGGGRGDTEVFRVFQFMMFVREASVGVSVLLLRVFHLLIDGLTLVRVRVRRGGHGCDRVGRGRLAVSREHFAHHLDIDRLILSVPRLILRVRCLKRQGCGRRRHTWRERVKGKLGAGTSLGL